jgi:hypothetical protein
MDLLLIEHDRLIRDANRRAKVAQCEPASRSPLNPDNIQRREAVRISNRKNDLRRTVAARGRSEPRTEYREAVVRLSLGMVATTAHGNQRLDEGIRATCCDADLNILFRIVMQCQIIDDVLDYSKDLSAGLPSFLTASRSLPQAFELTRLAALGYADDRDLPRTGKVFPLRSALFLVSTCTKLVIVLGQWRQRIGCNGAISTKGVVVRTHR